MTRHVSSLSLRPAVSAQLLALFVQICDRTQTQNRIGRDPARTVEHPACLESRPASTRTHTCTRAHPVLCQV